MCTTFFKSFRKNPNYKFVIAFNRDMNFSRPTSPCHFWEADRNIVGGKDEVLGGSWFLFNIKTGNIAFLTNFHESIYERHINTGTTLKQSRGLLLLEFVLTDFFEKHECTPESGPIVFMKEFEDHIQDFAPLNLVVGNLYQDVPHLYYMDYDNHQISILDPDYLYGLSNSSLFRPYKKVESVLSKFSDRIVSNLPVVDLKNLLWEMINTSINCAPSLSLDSESSVFIPPYWNNKLSTLKGTQSQLVLIIYSTNKYEIREISYQPKFPVIDRFRSGKEVFRKVRKCVCFLIAERRLKNKGYLGVRSKEVIIKGELW